jgi:hypothetical protein
MDGIIDPIGPSQHAVASAIASTRGVRCHACRVRCETVWPAGSSASAAADAGRRIGRENASSRLRPPHGLLSALDVLVNERFALQPSRCTGPMQSAMISANMTAYSLAESPSSDRPNRHTFLMN